MPKEKADLTAAPKDAPDMTAFYYAMVPTKLLRQVEARRKKRLHNKAAAVITMMELYLSQESEEA